MCDGLKRERVKEKRKDRGIRSVWEPESEKKDRGEKWNIGARKI